MQTLYSERLHFNLLERLLSEGSVLSMSAIREAYTECLQANGVMKYSVNVSTLKRQIVKHINYIQLSKSKQKNESERVFSSVARDVAIDKVIESDIDMEKDM